MTDTRPRPDIERLLRHVPDVITVVDGEGVVQYGSDAIETVLGYRPSDLVGRTALEYVHPDDREQATALVRGPADDEAPTTEFRFRHADGSWVRLEAVAASEPTAGGGYLIDARDVTDRRAGDRERERILDRMTDGFCALDHEWRYTYVNERVATLLESTPDDLLGTELWETFPEAVETEAYDHLQTAVDTGETVTFEFRYEPLSTLFEVRAYPDANGLTLYVRDVTERRRTETELERSVETLNDLYEIAADTDLDFEEKRSKLLQLGRSYFDLSYGFVSNIADGTQTIVASEASHELLQPGSSCPLEESYCRKTIAADEILTVADAGEDGWEDDRAFEVFGLGSYIGAKLVVDGDLSGTLCFASTEPRSDTFSDSERTFVELAARWLAYELEQRQYREHVEERNERLEEFASIVSHDLRNPLNVAQGSLEAARAETDSDHLDAVTESHDRMAALIDDLLTLAQEGDSIDDREPVNLGTLCSECWATVDSRDATLHVETDVVVDADESRLRQLLENLFRNAIDHGGDDVTITVADLPDGFYVEDDGPGVPETDRERVFESGVTTDEEGTGFGLRIVDEIAGAHGWTVTLTESAAGGARFEITGVGRTD